MFWYSPALIKMPMKSKFAALNYAKNGFHKRSDLTYRED